MEKNMETTGIMENGNYYRVLGLGAVIPTPIRGIK